MSWGIRLLGLNSTLRLFKDIQARLGDDAVYVVGTNVEYAIFLEFGTSRMPPYPFFFPAVRELQRNPERFIKKNTNKDVDNIGSVRELVKTIAAALERQIKTNATASRGGRSPGTHPEHPQVPTGNLRGSIRFERVR